MIFMLEGAHVTLPVLHYNVQTREKLNNMFSNEIWPVCLLGLGCWMSEQWQEVPSDRLMYGA
jgi:hypothetical protein